MDPKLYTEEFRTMKILRSSPEMVVLYKKHAAKINAVQPFADVNDPNFSWPNRIEFMEQLIDCAEDTVYLVEPGTLKFQSAHAYDYEEARLLTIQQPRIYRYDPTQHPLGTGTTGPEITDADMADLEDPHSRNFCVSSARWTSHNVVYILSNLPVVYHPVNTSYASFFYDAGTAKRYKVEVTAFLRKNNDSISAISRLI